MLRHSDLLGAGLSRQQITRWIAIGRLTRLHHHVYALGQDALAPKGHWLAALWSLGTPGALSHSTAIAFHGYAPFDPAAPIHVSTTGKARSREGIVIHRVRRLDAKDVFRPHPFVVTTIPRTVVDAADTLPYNDLRDFTDRLPYLQLGTIEQAQTRAPNRRGAPQIARLLDADSAHTKSEFERRYLRFCDSSSLPRPDDKNVRIAGHRADCVYNTSNLIIELDGRAYHRRRREMRKDRQRDADYQLAGYKILRLLWDDLHAAEAADTAGRIRRFITVPR